MRFYVGRRDLKKGKKCDSSFCPVACAIRKKFPWHEERIVSVQEKLIQIGLRTYKPPEKVKRFIKNFDTGLLLPIDFEPFSFSLKVKL